LGHHAVAQYRPQSFALFDAEESDLAEEDLPHCDAPVAALGQAHDPLLQHSAVPTRHCGCTPEQLPAEEERERLELTAAVELAAGVELLTGALLLAGAEELDGQAQVKNVTPHALSWHFRLRM
jgi:hypothetical protein